MIDLTDFLPTRVQLVLLGLAAIVVLAVLILVEFFGS